MIETREARDNQMREEGAKAALENILSSFDSLDSYGEEEGYPLVSLLDVQNRVELIKDRIPPARAEAGA